MAKKEPTIVDFLEDVTAEVTKILEDQIDDLVEKMGERPLFTERMDDDEKMLLYMDTEMQGPEGWLAFYQARREEGMDNETAQYELLHFNDWAQKRIEKDPKILERLQEEYGL